MTALAGANMIYGGGMLESGITFDLAQLVMDNEFARMIRACVAGIEVSDETLSVDVLEEVGPFGDFLGHDDTLKRMRTQSSPKLMDRNVYEDWTLSGAKDVYEKASEEAIRILETHEPTPLEPGMAEDVSRLIAETELTVAEAERRR